MNKLTLSIAGLILAAATSGCHVSDHQPANTRGAEYEVYAAILDTAYAWPKGVSDSVLFPIIVDSTSNGNTIDGLLNVLMPLDRPLRVDSTGREIRIEPLTYLRNHLHPRELEGVEVDSLVVRFNQINLKRLPIDSSLFENSIRAKLISRGELNPLLKAGWPRFRTMFPKSHGIVTFSRVAFNDSLSQAFLYWEQLRDYVSGEGGYLILRRDTGHGWTIVFEYRQWVA